MLARLLFAACATAALAGCGNARTAPPDVTTPSVSLGTKPQRYAAAGISFLAPVGWTTQPGQAPLVATLSSGRAALSIFRYPRTEPLPRTAAQLGTAAEALAGAARQRDASFAELRRSTLRVDGRPAVVLRGTETIDGQLRTVRSTHVYAFGGELVIDAIAPAADFKRVDTATFRALVRSLQIARPAD